MDYPYIRMVVGAITSITYLASNVSLFQPFQRAGTVAWAAYEPFAYPGCQLSDNHNDRHVAVDIAALHGERHIVGRLAVHIHQCGVCHGADVCRCGVHFYPEQLNM